MGPSRIGQGGCDWLSIQEGYLLLGPDWAGCADLADEGADVAPLGPLVISFIRSHEIPIGPNITDRDRYPMRDGENQDKSSRPHTHPEIHHNLTAPNQTQVLIYEMSNTSNRT